MKNLSDSKILVVDDTKSNIDLLVNSLGDDYDVSVALEGKAALEIADREPPDLVLLDIMMPEMDGFAVCRELKINERTRNSPVIFLSAVSETSSKTDGFALGAVDYIQKPFDILEMKARVRTHLLLRQTTYELERQNERLEEMVRDRTREITLTQDATIMSLASLAEYRDPETGAHINRSRKYIEALALQLSTHPKHSASLSEKNIEMIVKSTPLHDIGKVGVPDSILMKPGSLTSEEEAIMRMHPQYGHDTILSAEEMLGSNSFLRFAREIAYTHHERWDGTGYPQGLKGDAIPLVGRLMALVDVYDALISKRVYKEAMSHRKAVRIITRGDGRTSPDHFDPDVLDAFRVIEGEFEQIALMHAKDKVERLSYSNSNTQWRQ
jgi:putative two-component system response regulator